MVKGLEGRKDSVLLDIGILATIYDRSSRVEREP
jgi:hypothetical protein